MARLTERDAFTRARWAAFLRPLIGSGKPISITALDEAVAALMGRSGDARAELYAYLNGTQTARPKRAYWCGEALRGLGVRWCSAPTALYAAGHFAEWVHFLAKMASDPEQGESAAVVLAAYTPIAVLLDEQIRLDLGVYSGAACAWARTKLIPATSQLELEYLKWAFARSPANVGDPVLTEIEKLARSAMDPVFAESIVLGAVRVWALQRADPKLQKVIAHDTLWFQKLHVARITKSTPKPRSPYAQLRAPSKENK